MPTNVPGETAKSLLRRALILAERGQFAAARENAQTATQHLGAAEAVRSTNDTTRRPA